MLELKPRIDFGGQPWPNVVSQFSLAWLKGSFHPAQVARRDRVIAAIADGEKRVEEVRQSAADNVPTFGDRRSNGTIYLTPADQQLQRAAKTIADHQAVDQIRRIRLEIDALVLADLKAMERASVTAKTLSERVFTKLSCLSRASFPGWKDADLIGYKANYASLLRGAAPIELHRIAQDAIDDGSPVSLVVLDCVRRENFGRKKDERPFLNQTLLDLINVPEFNEAVGTEERPGLLHQIINLHGEAGRAWANFLGRIGQASTFRIARGLAGMKLDTTGLPAAGEQA